MKLTVMGVEIRQDKDGLYSLNDVHRASGTSMSKKPSEWLSNRQPNAIAELITNREGYPALSVRNKAGTYACRELVLFYATWLDDTFCLEVMQAFDALLQGDVEKALDIARRNSLRFEYPDMSETLRNIREQDGKDTQFFHYAKEADLLNLVALGYTAKSYRHMHNIPDDVMIRDFVNAEERERLLFLQRVNTSLIACREPYSVRKQKLLLAFSSQFGIQSPWVVKQ